MALPITLALAAERQAISGGDQVGLLGIGSGINCLLCAIDWQHSRIAAMTARRVQFRTAFSGSESARRTACGRFRWQSKTAR